MDTTPFVEAIGKSGLPFVYSGDKLQDEKCQKALKKIGGEGTVMGAIMGNALVGLEGLAVTDKGVWFSISSGATGEMKVPKIKGAFPFDAFILHSVTVKKGKKAMLHKFDVEFVMFDIKKAKSFTFMFELTQDSLDFEESMTDELDGIFKTLVSTTGTEYTSMENAKKTETAEAAFPKDPNTFDFEYDNSFAIIHTIIVLDDKNVVIKKLKVDEKTKIQTLIGSPVNIPRSAIDSVTKGKVFSPMTLLKSMGVGIGAFIFLWIFIWGLLGIIAFVLFTAIGLFISFPMSLTIKRKDGQKFSTRFYGGGKSEAEYERFINTIFQ